jgi:hypothetical protein
MKKRSVRVMSLVFGLALAAAGCDLFDADDSSSPDTPVGGGRNRRRHRFYRP